MTTIDSRPAPAVGPAWTDRAVIWFQLSVTAALLAAAGNLCGLLNVPAVYGRETSAFVDQAIAQDLVNLVVVAPAIIGLAYLARRGSLYAYLMWLGGLAFTTYNYVIYTLSVHVGPLFLVWVTVLGLSTFSLVGGLAALDGKAVGARFGRAAPRRLTGWFLVAAPGLLVFFALTGLPIMVTPFVAQVRGDTAAWAVLPPIGVITVACLAVLIRLFGSHVFGHERGLRARLKGLEDVRHIGRV